MIAPLGPDTLGVALTLGIARERAWGRRRLGLLLAVPSERLRLERRPARFPRGSGSAGCRFDLCADLVGPSAPATLSRDVRSLMITSPER
jgi:hypothetical protein